jgi:hypothetical protein
MERIQRDAPHQPRRAIAEPIGNDRVAELVKDESDQKRDDEGDEENENCLETFLPDEKLENGTPYLQERLPLSITTSLSHPMVSP